MQTLTNKGAHEIMLGKVNWTGNTIVVIACTGFTVNVDTQQFISDIISHQVTATGYVSGGFTLTGKTVTRNDTNDRIEYKAGNAVWSITGTMTAQVFVVAKYTGNNATSPILYINDKGTPQSRTDDDFIVEWDNGIIITAEVVAT